MAHYFSYNPIKVAGVDYPALWAISASCCECQHINTIHKKLKREKEKAYAGCRYWNGSDGYCLRTVSISLEYLKI